MARNLKKKSNNKSKFNETITARGSYTVVPNELWAWPISSNAVRVFGFLLAQSESWMSSYDDLAESMKISRRQVMHAIKQLEAYSILHVEKEEGWHNCYHFVDQDKWLEVPNEQPSPSKADEQKPPELKPKFSPEVIALQMTARFQQFCEESSINLHRNFYHIEDLIDSFIGAGIPSDAIDQKAVAKILCPQFNFDDEYVSLFDQYQIRFMNNLEGTIKLAYEKADSVRRRITSNS